MPMNTNPTWGEHTDFHGFVVKSDMEVMPMYLPVIRTTFTGGMECDTCMQQATYEIVDVAEACTTVICQDCAVDNANSEQLGNPDSWLPAVIFRVLLSATQFFYVHHDAVDARSSVRFDTVKRLGHHYADADIVPINWDLWIAIRPDEAA